MAREFQKGQKTPRLLDLVQILAAAPQGVTTADLARRTGMTIRTIQRDLHELQRMETTKLRQDGRRWRLVEGSVHRSAAFSSAETVALLMACRLAVRHADYNDQALAMALAKLTSALPSSASLVQRFVAETAGELSQKGAAAGRAETRARLVDAWLSSRKVRIAYRDIQGVESTRVIHPYCLEPAAAGGRGTYLLARDEKSRQVRSFKIERIREVAVLDVQYRLPPEFSLAEYLRDSWSIWSSVAPVEIVLRFAPTAAARATEANWHPSQTVRVLRGGAVELRFRVRGTLEIQSWILGWGEEVEVLAPPDLRQAITTRTRAAAAVYGREKPDK